jgi:DNA-directed RNA polymerase subunit RPC12/RpoP
VTLVPEAEIVCVDCGGRCFLLTLPREDGAWLPGDIVTYRCQDCRDRWDLVLPDEDAGAGDAVPDDAW